MNTPNIKNSIKERLAFAYQVISGIPGDVIELDSFRTKKGQTLECGTICCGAGWLALHPVFNELGLTADVFGRPQTIKSVRLGDYSDDALEEIFGKGSYRKFFTLRGAGTYDRELVNTFCLHHEYQPSDKELLLARLKKGYHMSRFNPRKKAHHEHV